MKFYKHQGENSLGPNVLGDRSGSGTCFLYADGGCFLFGLADGFVALVPGFAGRFGGNVFGGLTGLTGSSSWLSWNFWLCLLMMLLLLERPLIGAMAMVLVSDTLKSIAAF